MGVVYTAYGKDERTINSVEHAGYVLCRALVDPGSNKVVGRTEVERRGDFFEALNMVIGEHLKINKAAFCQLP